MMETKIEYILTEDDFEFAFNRKPKTKEEFTAFCYLCKKGLDAQIEWDVVVKEAREAMRG